MVCVGSPNWGGLLSTMSEIVFIPLCPRRNDITKSQVHAHAFELKSMRCQRMSICFLLAWKAHEELARRAPPRSLHRSERGLSAQLCCYSLSRNLGEQILRGACPSVGCGRVWTKRDVVSLSAISMLSFRLLCLWRGSH